MLFLDQLNSVVYNTLETTCNQLSITTTFIPMLLAYWLIISVIYFLYDIALLLIWSAHDKIHELRDSLWKNKHTLLSTGTNCVT